MKISKREVNQAEYQAILADFRRIDAEFGLPDAAAERLNITVDEDGAVVGFASGLLHHKWFYLTDLWIHEARRRCGLGAKILKMLEADAQNQGAAHIYTCTTAYNSNEKFYEKQGYAQCLVLADFFAAENGHQIFLRKDF